MRVVVVGAGVVGLACGYELLQDGHRVTVLDSGRPGAGASHGNAAKIAIAEAGPVPAPGLVVQGLKWMLRPDSPLYVRPSLAPAFVAFMLQLARNCTAEQFRAGLALNLELATRSPELLDEWADAGLAFEMHRRGVLLAYGDTGHFRTRLAQQEVFDRFGARAEVLDATGVQQVEPALSDQIRHGLFYPGDRQVEPDSLTSALAQHIGKLGGRVLGDCRVTGFATGPGGGVSGVRTDRAEHGCDAVVLAAGVWTRALAAQLGVALPIEPGKGYSLDYTPAPLELRTSLTLEDAHVAVTPLDGFVRVAGTMEFSGLRPGINVKRVEAIRRAVAEGFRDWDPAAPHLEAWAGMRPMTSDGLPVIGRLGDHENVWVASGHAMLGLAQAPTTGRAIRELVRGGAEDPRLSHRRFQRRRTRRPPEGVSLRMVA